MSSDDVVFSTLPGKGGDLGHILLNRPKALNALTLEMCQRVGEHLHRWDADNAIKAVVIRGAGDRAFCAGGDIRNVYYQGRQNRHESEKFFKQEYGMNSAIFHFNKPYISFLNGITMGGGVGISLHGSHRIGTERLVFAMPETGIGFFPDVGVGYFLSRCPYKMGYYLGLSGARLGPADSLWLGITTHTVSSEHQETLLEVLLQTPFTDHHDVNRIINQFTLELPDSALIHNRHNIQNCFSQPTMEKILLQLEAVNDEWSSSIKTNLLQKSPTSLKVTLEHLRRAETANFDAVIQTDFTLAKHFLDSEDFYEGIRAAVIDKDQSPKWVPNRIDDVTNERVFSFFEL